MAALQSVVVFANAADTIAAGRPLSGSQRPLVSKSGKFALGFFQPGTANTKIVSAAFSYVVPPAHVLSESIVAAHT
ncbi:hypothetical protein E2562_017904 [Oryza meyeriana var. granulata]|uniref:Uncharacterized protein n=1 Tax=Oryza meyeriana var. granulata TaxID=110450 RepID=A0A6G1CPI3_9ORYZ|nr:hypothetical protein E2562_017904 [Oryza meyeriana var. granulata]